MRDHWKAGLIALSFANLCYLRIWTETLTYTTANTYLMKELPSRSLILAAILDVLLLAAALWAAAYLIHRADIPWLTSTAKLVAVILCVIPANAIRVVLANTTSPYLKGELLRALGPTLTILTVMAVGTTVAVPAMLVRKKLFHSIASTLLVMSPFAAVTLFQGFAAAVHATPGPLVDNYVIPHHLGHLRNRVVWIVFDALDERIAFSERPNWLKMPEFDGLAERSLQMTNAYSPSGATLTAIPTLLTGQTIVEATTMGRDDLRVVPDNGGTAINFRRLPNIFDYVKHLGGASGVVGWFHPYCRELGDRVAACAWWDMPMQYNSAGAGLAQQMTNHLRSLFETSTLSPFGQSLTAKHHAKMHQEMIREAVKMASAPGFDLVFLHLSIPHGPHFYDARNRQFSLANAPLSGYYDALELADVSLGEIRKGMETAHLWDSSTLLVTSDHWYRSAKALGKPLDHRVPVLLKCRGSMETVTIGDTFSTVQLYYLVRDILADDTFSLETAKRWFANRNHKH